MMGPDYVDGSRFDRERERRRELEAEVERLRGERDEERAKMALAWDEGWGAGWDSCADFERDGTIRDVRNPYAGHVGDGGTTGGEG